MKLPECEVKRSAPTLIFLFMASAGVPSADAAAAPPISAIAPRLFSFVMLSSLGQAPLVPRTQSLA